VLYLTGLNNELYQGSGMFFMTALYGYFDFSDGGAAFTFAKGGHPPPILYRASDGTAKQLRSEGIPIGIAQASGFEEVSRNLLPGDRVFLYTDGIIEARDENKEMIEPEGLERIISKTGGMGLRDSLNYIIEEVRRFRGSEPVEDDLVLIGFETLNPVEGQR
jgi:phosphoserine phosphatase RsbU/P